MDAAVVELDKLADRHERLERRHEAAFGQRRPDAGVVIVADPRYIRSFSGQVTWATLLNLTARLYKGIRRIRIVLDAGVPRLPHVFFPNARKDLLEASLQLLEDLNADAFTIEEGEPPSDGREWIWIYVGAREDRCPAGITVAGQGWLAFINDESWLALPLFENPIGPMVAACFGTAEIYKALYPLREKKEPKRIVLSAFDYSNNMASNPALPGPLHLPKTYIAGAGAVGMALLLVLDSTLAIRSGSGLHVVEYDSLDDTNMNRCVLAVIKDINSPKLAIVKSRLDTARLALELHNSTWQSFVEKPDHREPSNFRRVVSCVDRYAARRAVQYHQLPKTLFTAGTGDFLLTVSRHSLGDGLSCGLCYQARDAEPSCATATEGALTAFELPPDPSISFVSALAGIMLGAELLKDLVPELHQGCVRNSVRAQLLTGTIRSAARAKDPGCNCSSKYVAIGYRNVWQS